jgi:hypothetical protein
VEARPVPLALVFLLACGALALALKPGAFLNDELAQAASLDGLARGHIWTSGDLPGYAPYLKPIPLSGNATVYGHWAIPAPGQRGPPVGSTMLNVLALPLLTLLLLLNLLLGVQLAVALPAAALCAGAAWAALRWLGATRKAQALAAALALAAFLPLPLPGRAPAGAPGPTLEFAALILVSILATGVAAAFLFGLLRSWLPQEGALLATAAALATPLLFWAETAKYSSLSVALAVLAAWCYRDGGRTGPLRTVLAFALAGLAVWNQAPWGVFLLLALACVALGALRLGTKPALARAGAALAGFSIGVLPEVLTRLLVRQAGIESQYGPGDLAHLLDYVRLQLQPGGFLASSVLTDPWGAPYAALRGLVWPSWLEDHYALPFLAIAPLAAAGIAALLLPRLRAGTPRPVLALGGLYAVLALCVMGRRFLDIGDGPDLRHGLTFWPFLAVLWAPLLAGLAARRGLRWAATHAALAALAVLLLSVALNLGAHAAHQALTPHGYLYDQTAVLRYGGLLLAALLAGILLVPGRWRRWQDDALAAALGFGAAAQAIVLLVATGAGTFAAWPVGLLLKALHWLLVGSAPPYA